MPNEAEIRKRAIKILTNKNWICWYPSRARYKQNDIFGIIDLLAIKGKRLKKIQLTTLPNVSTKRKKIKSFFKKTRAKLSVEIWAWSNKNKRFKIEKIKSS